jgi:hypothetical protein
VGIDTDGRELAVSGVVIDGCVGPGIWAAYGGSVTGSDIAIRSMIPSDTGNGAGLYFYEGGQGNLGRVSIEESSGIGIAAFDDGTSVTIEDLVVIGTRAFADDGGGHGVLAQLGPQLTLTRAVLEDNVSAAIMAPEGSNLTLTDVIMRATKGTPRRGFGGRGLELHPGATVEGVRLLAEDNLDVGMAIGGEATLSDIVVRGVRNSPLHEDYGIGMGIESGSVATMDRAVVEDVLAIGVYVSDSGTRATLRDFVVRDVLPSTDTMGVGRGFNIQMGSVFTGERILIERTRDVGFFVSSPTTIANVTDIAVLSTESRVDDGTGGNGLHVQRMAQMTVSRALVRSARGIGAVAMDFSTSNLEDVWIEDVQPRACVETTCADAPFGYGIASVATTRVRGFHVEGATFCGAFVARVDEGSLDLEQGTITGAPIGACVQIDGYDLSRLMNDVQYIDNDRSLDTTMLPVPEPI